jgi:hypothetical protein
MCGADSWVEAVPDRPGSSYFAMEDVACPSCGDYRLENGALNLLETKPAAAPAVIAALKLLRSGEPRPSVTRKMVEHFAATATGDA